ncbi:Cupredoxin [Talaromyces proteolyticus]|uniref:Cupredoxin n=1 Tax=Talaromyces proteolyticus TaxID=1131652 RepID=A0AAD4KXJ6_9EURO|nr:Cupredoxin [Talaromyces proteolyticus]KAH8703390.1 Cupredoxin [Talaromyces proteolyticus]
MKLLFHFSVLAFTHGVAAASFPGNTANTGIIREYHFEITDVTVAPDGYPWPVINGSTMVADWGDTVMVHVTNALQSSTNGTSFSFHVIRQNYTNMMDRVIPITQCPKAIQYGSSWYHSHFGLQVWEGVVGGIVINGPASTKYGEDEGILFPNDWTHQTSPSEPRKCFNFPVDNNALTIIANELVPIQPHSTTILSIDIGQRYDVIITADKSFGVDNFWLRAIPQAACSENDSADNIRSIVYYGDSPGIPNTTGYTYVDNCEMKIHPIFNQLCVIAMANKCEYLLRLYLDGFTMQVKWDNPNLLQIYNNEKVDEWVYVLIESSIPTPHPIHLHEHDFSILAQGTGNYTASSYTTLINPLRRDTATLPTAGYLLLTFQADNPMFGFALQFVERYHIIRDLIDEDSLTGTCESWNAFSTDKVVEGDSGI